MDEKNLRAYLVEMVGTFALVLVSAGAVVVSELPGALRPERLSIALAAGLIYAVALAFSLPLSGGYLNPAVVITLWVFKRLDGGRALALIAVQILGAVIAGLLVRGLFTPWDALLEATRVGTPYLHLDALNAAGVTLVPLLKGIAIELVLTFLLVFAVFAFTFDPRVRQWLGPTATRLTALWLGVALAAVTIVGSPLTGGAVNPARWFGPAVAELTVGALRTQSPFHGPFADHSVYWIGPIAGALLAGWLYTALVLPLEEEAQVPVQTPARAGTAVSSTLFRARR